MDIEGSKDNRSDGIDVEIAVGSSVGSTVLLSKGSIEGSKSGPTDKDKGVAIKEGAWDRVKVGVAVGSCVGVIETSLVVARLGAKLLADATFCSNITERLFPPLEDVGTVLPVER